jgi:hypothetical protein
MWHSSFIFLLHFQCAVFVPAVILLSIRNWASWSNRLLTFHFLLLRLFQRIQAICNTSAVCCHRQFIFNHLWTVPVLQDRNFPHTNGQLMCHDCSFKITWHICNEKDTKICVITVTSPFLTACINFSSTEFHSTLQTFRHPSFGENRTEITITVYNRTCFSVCIVCILSLNTYHNEKYWVRKIETADNDAQNAFSISHTSLRQLKRITYLLLYHSWLKQYLTKYRLRFTLHSAAAECQLFC